MSYKNVFVILCNFFTLKVLCLHLSAILKLKNAIFPLIFKFLFQGFQTRLEAACTAYLTARQEVSILEGLSHPHIVPFMGLALRPLSLVLGLAPHGALDSVLKRLHGAGTYLPLFVIRQILLQVCDFYYHTFYDF